MPAASLFHPAVAARFEANFTTATAAQADAWPLIKAGRHTLIAAPTGSGKTRAAFATAYRPRPCEALVRGTGRGSSLAAEWAAAPDVAPAGS